MDVTQSHNHVRVRMHVLFRRMTNLSKKIDSPVSVCITNGQKGLLLCGWHDAAAPPPNVEECGVLISKHATRRATQTE